MSQQRVKLSKKLFMGLQPGQYIMGNFMPLTYEEIGPNPEDQWENWRMYNGNSVDIFDSKEECLREWWELSYGFKGERTTKALFNGQLSKKTFMAQPDGYYILFMQDPYEYFEFQGDRENQWKKTKDANGRRVQIFKYKSDCIMERNRLFSKFRNG